ncbi:MAG: stage III sporulation protein AC [Caldicoprobacterales bacterium]|jgi:stage III sporulation protein AC|nr:stage III sporulation protein AC [Clostridia bacterium]MDI9513220.1 stage III sporulation protein AC [Bacillota bacterium]NLH59058.1 stage III sporulation protein AC [Clostridiales bacterium]
MSIDIIFKIAAIGILVAVINQVLVKAGRDEIAMMTTLAGIIVVLLMIVNMISQLFTSIKQIFQLY